MHEWDEKTKSMNNGNSRQIGIYCHDTSHVIQELEATMPLVDILQIRDSPLEDPNIRPRISLENCPNRQRLIVKTSTNPGPVPGIANARPEIGC
jgi:hypothetical protein